MKLNKEQKSFFWVYFEYELQVHSGIVFTANIQYKLSVAL